MHANYKRALLTALYLILMVCATGCKHSHDTEHSHPHEHEQHDHEHEVESKEHSNLIFFPKEQGETVDFATAKAEVKPFGEVLRTMALVEPSNGDERVIVAKASGIVYLAGDKAVDGKSVSAGETLFTIDATAMADNNLSVKLKEAETEYNRAKKEYERKEGLLKDKLVTEGDFQRSKAEYEQAASNYEALKKGFAGGKSTGVSPINGFVKRVYVRNGEFVNAGAPVAEVTQNRNLYLRAEISPRKVAGLKNIAGATLKNPTDGEVYNLKDLGGSLVSVGKTADAQTPLVPVVFQATNTVDFIPGTFVEMYITSGDTPSLIVPVSAIVEEMGSYFVFVEAMPEHYEKRQVSLGKTDGKNTQILSGVKEGETIVAKGAVLVKLAQASGKLDAHAGHVH